MDPRRIFGNEGEKLAATFLQSIGMILLESQYANRFGEIDLICLDGDEVVFVEVKSRHTMTFGYPEDSVTPEKIRRMLRVTQSYLESTKRVDSAWRLDVVAIEFDFVPPKITHLKNIDIPESLW
jgi:putative endonuclease